VNFNKIWETLTQCWQIKMIVSFFVTVFTFLVGQVEAPFIALWVLVIVDTITKWAGHPFQRLPWISKVITVVFVMVFTLPGILELSIAER